MIKKVDLLFFNVMSKYLDKHSQILEDWIIDRIAFHSKRLIDCVD